MFYCLEQQQSRQSRALLALGLLGGVSAACGPCLANVSASAPDTAFLQCCACSEPLFSISLNSSAYAMLCDDSQSPDIVAELVAQGAYALGEMQGHWWLDDSGDLEENAYEAFKILFAHMPRRDSLLLFNDWINGIDFISEHVRHSLFMWPRLQSAGVSFDIWADAILPYSILNEKRDFEWRWRPRLQQLFASAWDGADNNFTAAMHNLSDMIPNGAPDFANAFLVGDNATVVPGNQIRWRSSTSPGFLSPQQVASAFGSCTGTGIIMVAAARAIGIPARLAGCSQTDVINDDHHWIEFYDPASPGPFSTFWHTKEGTSKGNTGGPWDSPSGPMNGCLRGVIPGSTLNTLWASSWSSPTYLPTLWASDGPLTGKTWSFVGGISVCGAYCSAWGCGINQTSFWNQSQCGP